MEKDGLKLGDVVLFEADDSCISRLICKISGSNVSHAAMYYDDLQHLIVEEVSVGVRTAPAPGGPDQTRIAHTRRFKGRPLDQDKLIQAARHYLEHREPYSYANLVLAGVLLIFEQFINNKKYKRYMTAFLKIACSLLADYIKKKRHPGQTPMTCSQFVAQCYTEAGYTLLFDNKLLAMKENSNALPSLADLAVERLRRHGLPNIQIQPSEQLDEAAILNLFPTDDFLVSDLLGDQIKIDPAVLLEKVCCLILKLLKDNKASQPDPVEVGDELLALCATFAGLVLDIERGDTAEAMPLAGVGPQSAAQKIIDLRNMFVTPGDLLSHCTNLQDAGTIKPSH